MASLSQGLHAQPCPLEITDSWQSPREAPSATEIHVREQAAATMGQRLAPDVSAGRQTPLLLHSGTLSSLWQIMNNTNRDRWEPEGTKASSGAWSIQRQHLNIIGLIIPTIAHIY